METLIIAMIINPRYKNKLLTINDKKRCESIFRDAVLQYHKQMNPEKKEIKRENEENGMFSTQIYISIILISLLFFTLTFF